MVQGALVHGGMGEVRHAAVGLQGDARPPEDHLKVYGDLRLVDKDPGEVQPRLLYRQLGNETVIVPVGDGEEGMGLGNAAEALPDHMVGVGAAEQKGVKTLGIFLIDLVKMLQRGIGQIGDLAALAHLFFHLHDAVQRLLGGDNTDGIHEHAPFQRVL